MLEALAPTRAAVLASHARQRARRYSGAPSARRQRRPASLPPVASAASFLLLDEDGSDQAGEDDREVRELHAGSLVDGPRG